MIQPEKKGSRIEILGETASTRFPKFVIRLRIFANELRKAKGTSKPMMLVPPFDLKFLLEFAAGGAGTSNRRH
jgi:hypothetical protein